MFQVDAGLQFENSKHKYQYMFDVCTPKRVYYLAAETESDMNKWVDCVCHVCGLKSYPQDENGKRLLLRRPDLELAREAPVKSLTKRN